jgi:hypothetical protein
MRQLQNTFTFISNDAQIFSQNISTSVSIFIVENLDTLHRHMMTYYFVIFVWRKVNLSNVEMARMYTYIHTYICIYLYGRLSFKIFTFNLHAHYLVFT